MPDADSLDHFCGGLGDDCAGRARLERRFLATPDTSSPQDAEAAFFLPSVASFSLSEPFSSLTVRSESKSDSIEA